MVDDGDFLAAGAGGNDLSRRTCDADLAGGEIRIGFGGRDGIALPDRDAAERALETLGLMRLRDRPITEISGGERQLALFARALGSDAQIVLMDDPMRGVDYGTKLEVYDLVREEARAGRTFLWYTTETEELKNCDRVYVFRDGAIVAHLARDELTEERIIQSSFAGAH